MGATLGMEETPPMSEVDFESYTGHRYTQEVPNSREQHRGPIFEVADRLATDAASLTLYDTFLMGRAKDNGTRPCYGTRARQGDGTVGDYEWMSYNTVFARMEAIASGVTHFARLQRQQAVGVFSKNRAEWCLVAHACDRMAYTLVPLYDSLGPEAVPYIINQTELTTLFCAQEQLPVVLACRARCPQLTFVVQYEAVTDQQRELAKQQGMTLLSLSDVEAMGIAKPLAADPPTPEDISTLCYTSGTTGPPKGVILTQKSMALMTYSGVARLQIGDDLVHFSYLPLPHVFERSLVCGAVRVGGQTGFYQGDLLQLLDDAAALRPTFFAGVPRVFNRIYDKITQGVETAGGAKKALFDQAYAAKKWWLAYGYKGHAVWDPLVFARARQVLGGRVRIMLSASAPLSADVKELLAIVFATEMLEGYGLSETTSALTASSADMPVGAHVGTPFCNMQVRLEDVPEMGYTSNDKPRPRGEVLCRGDTLFSGYYKEPERTAEVMDKDGWFHTGDIGCWNADGTLSIIDRKKNIFKLSQGEYVAAEKIEGVYGKSKYLSQVFVYGDSYQNALVSVAVPDPEIAQAWAASHGRSGEDCTTAKLVQDPEFMSDVVADMTHKGKEAKLRGFEFVKKLHLHPDLFTVDNGLITPTFKLKRPQLKAQFESQIDGMYASLKR